MRCHCSATSNALPPYRASSQKRRLASTPACANQVFSWGRHCLAFQCHPEADSQRLEAWLIGHASELAQHRIDLAALRQASAALGPALRQQAQQCVADWWALQ